MQKCHSFYNVTHVIIYIQSSEVNLMDLFIIGSCFLLNAGPLVFEFLENCRSPVIYVFKK